MTNTTENQLREALAALVERSIRDRSELASNGGGQYNAEADRLVVAARAALSAPPGEPATQAAGEMPGNILSILRTGWQSANFNEVALTSEQVNAAADWLLAAPQAGAPEAMEPFLVRDLASELGRSVPEVCIALRDAGLGNYSTNTALTRKAARAVRECLVPSMPQAGAQAAEVRVEREMTRLIEQRDHAYEVIDELMEAVLGADRPEWSSAYGTHDAVRDVKERMAWIAPGVPPASGAGEPVAWVEPGMLKWGGQFMAHGGHQRFTMPLYAHPMDKREGEPAEAAQKPVAEVIFTGRKKPDVEWLVDSVRVGTKLYASTPPAAQEPVAWLQSKAEECPHLPAARFSVITDAWKKQLEAEGHTDHAASHDLPLVLASTPPAGTQEALKTWGSPLLVGLRRAAHDYLIEGNGNDAYHQAFTAAIERLEELESAPAGAAEKLQALRTIIADDAYAITFQTFGQYRTQLLKEIDALVSRSPRDPQGGGQP